MQRCARFFLAMHYVFFSPHSSVLYPFALDYVDTIRHVLAIISPIFIAMMTL